jgi:hypothetical protein
LADPLRYARAEIAVFAGSHQVHWSRPKRESQRQSRRSSRPRSTRGCTARPVQRLAGLRVRHVEGRVSTWPARTPSWACNAFTAVSRRVGRCGRDACRRNMQGRGRARSELRPPAFLAMPWGSQDDRFPQIRAGRAVSCPFWLDGMRVWVTGGCMSRQRMDADTAETMARVVQLLRRALSSFGRRSTSTVPGHRVKCSGWHRSGCGRGAEPASGRSSGRRAGAGRG